AVGRAKQGFRLLCGAQVLAAARIDLNLLADADERRNRDLETGLEDGRLVLSGGRRALDRGLGLLHDQLDHGGPLEADRAAFVDADLRPFAFLSVPAPVTRPILSRP